MVEDFGFIDQADVRWDVPMGAIVDGASIPQPLWSIIGGPFEGRYRDASIVRDWYCDMRSRPRQNVHRVFFGRNANFRSGESARQPYVRRGLLAKDRGGPKL